MQEKTKSNRNRCYHRLLCDNGDDNIYWTKECDLMTSLISVYETPVRMDIIFEQYKEGEVKVDTMELIDKMPEPELSKEKWYEKYGRCEMLWRVKIIHSDNIKFGGYKPYRSWEGVERAIRYPKKKEEAYEFL